MKRVHLMELRYPVCPAQVKKISSYVIYIPTNRSLKNNEEAFYKSLHPEVFHN
jgi:hypothetical protein